MPAIAPPKAALLQMTSAIEPAMNLKIIDQGLAEAAKAGATMAFLPEMSLMLDKDRQRSAHHIQPEAEHRGLIAYREMAAKHGIWLHSGSIAFASDDGERRVNRSHIIDNIGQIHARYDKIHMFDVSLPTGEKWTESLAYQGGDQAMVVNTPLGKLGLSICFDLRFPEYFRKLVEIGAEIIAVPAAFTVPTGEAHWHILLRARAIETGCFILAPAQAGQHEDGRTTFGHSLAIAPWGEILCDAGPAKPHSPLHICYAEISPEKIHIAREAIPLATSRKMRRITL